MKRKKVSDTNALVEKDATLDSILSLKNMRAFRLIRGLTQKELSEKSGLDRRQISFYETGWRVPRLESMLKIAEAMNVGCTKLKFISADGRDKTIEIICAVEIPGNNGITCTYRKIKEGYLISKRRM